MSNSSDMQPDLHDESQRKGLRARIGRPATWVALTLAAIAFALPTVRAIGELLSGNGTVAAVAISMLIGLIVGLLTIAIVALLTTFVTAVAEQVAGRRK